MGKAGRSEAYQRYSLCKTFGWDYDTLMRQPSWFIDEIVLIMYQEAQVAKMEQSKAERQNRPKGVR